MIIQQRGPSDQQDDPEKKQPLCCCSAKQTLQYLRHMQRIGKNADRPAARKDLDNDIVIHIGENPIFNVDVNKKRSIKPYPEQGRLEIIF